MRFIFYGKLKQEGKLNFLIPKNAKYEEIEIKGYKLYETKNTFKCIKTSNKNDILKCETCKLKGNKLKQFLLLSILDLVEGKIINRYRREKILINNDEYFIYLYNWRIKE